MAVKLNYRGVLITAKQYRHIANDISNKNFIHFSVPADPKEASKYLDSLWFRFGYSNSINIVITNNPHDTLTRLIYSGLLVDLRNHVLPTSQGGVYDLFHELLFGRNTRIQLCNDIRTVLAKLEQHRWCGAELESVFHPLVYKNATEICGNNPPGQYMTIEGGITGHLPVPMHEKHLADLYSFVVENNSDAGQKKLGLIMCAIPIVGYNIIYVGGSPGDAWTKTLRERNFSGMVIVIDPAPLSPGNDEGLEIHYFPMKIRRGADLERLLVKYGYLDKSNYVFIWDVRSDGFGEMSSDARRDVITEEVITLTDIITAEWFSQHVKAYQIKVNTSNIDLYSFPKDAKLFPQPFTLSRDVYELRCVGFVSSGGITLRTLAPCQINTLQDYLSNLMVELSHSLSEYILFLNFMTSIYRECDYIEEPALIDSRWEVALYTLNWNETNKLIRYYTRIQENKTRFVGSFFTQDMLGEGEHEFDESLLINTFPSFVFDSRALIPAKIEGLYFFANTIECRYMYNELIFSECYLIGATEYQLHSQNRMTEYDNARMVISKSKGMVFAKFPTNFSVSDEIVSPSGHSLRMFIEFISCKASLMMFLYKIISNFYSTGRTKIASDKRKMLFHDEDNECWLPEISERFVIEKVHLENCESTLWHSLTEWIIGYQSAVYLMKGKKEKVVEEVENFLRTVIKCDLKGAEIFRFSQRSMISEGRSSVAVPRHTLKISIDDPYIIKVIKVYKKLKQVKITDWAGWLVFPKPRTYLNEWQWAVTTLGIDASARDWYVHSAYVRTISNKYNAHDASKNSLLELVLNSIIMKSPANAHWAAIPHYIANSHHPQHPFLKKRHADILGRISVMDAFEDIYTLLTNVYSSCQEISPHMDTEHFENYGELAVDLIARRWQKVFPFERVLTREQLCNVQEYAFRYKNVDMQQLHEAVSLALESKEFYLKRDVEDKLANMMTALYP